MNPRYDDIAGKYKGYIITWRNTLFLSKVEEGLEINDVP